MPSLSSSVKLDNPLIPNSNGWANHGLPAACAKATLPYVSGVSSAGSPLYKVNCTSAVDLEGWDFGDTYQSGGIPVTMGSASGACTFANNNMNDSANIWAIGSHANMFYSGGTCPGGMTISNNYFDFKADTTWVGSFTYGVQFNNLLGNVTFKYNHWGNAPYRPVGFGPSCSVNAAITADYNDQNVAWQPTTLDAAHGDSGVNFECTTSPAAVSVTLDDEYNFQLNNKGSSSGTGAYVPANVGNTPGLGLPFTFKGNVVISNAFDVPANITFPVSGTLATVNSITNNYGDVNVTPVNNGDYIYNTTFGRIGQWANNSSTIYSSPTGYEGMYVATSDGTNPISPGQNIGDPGHPDMVCGVSSHVCAKMFLGNNLFSSFQFWGGNAVGTYLFIEPYANSSPFTAGEALDDTGCAYSGQPVGFNLIGANAGGTGTYPSCSGGTANTIEMPLLFSSGACSSLRVCVSTGQRGTYNFGATPSQTNVTLNVDAIGNPVSTTLWMDDRAGVTSASGAFSVGAASVGLSSAYAFSANVVGSVLWDSTQGAAICTVASVTGTYTVNCVGTTAIASTGTSDAVTFQGNGPGGTGAGQPIAYWNADVEDNQVDLSGAFHWVPYASTYANLTPNDGTGSGGIQNSDLNSGSSLSSFITINPNTGIGTQYAPATGTFAP